MLVTGSMAASVSNPVSPQRDSHVDRNQWTAESGSREVMAGTGMWVTGAVMRKSWALPGPGRTVLAVQVGLEMQPTWVRRRHAM